MKTLSERLYGRPGARPAGGAGRRSARGRSSLGLDRESHSVTREAGDVMKKSGAVDLGTLLPRRACARPRKEPDEIELLKFRPA